MSWIKHGSRSIDRVGGRETQTLVIAEESRSALEEAISGYIPGEFSDDLGGRVTGQKITQEGSAWMCEMTIESNPEGFITTIETPASESSFGKKSAELSGSRVTLPLSKVSGYRTIWDHYFVCSSQAELPAGWTEQAVRAATTVIIAPADVPFVTWIEDLSSLPVNPDGTRWTILYEPTKKDVTGVDYAIYSVTETAKFTSARLAGNMVSRTLNRIGEPCETFGLSAGGYTWKCDDAQVRWTGKYWIAQLTWTRSGDSTGWDTDLYRRI